MPPLNSPDKPKYVKAVKQIPVAGTDGETIEVRIWHRLVAVQASKRPLTALAACGDRYEPEGFLYGERTLIDWAEEDDLCECAVEMPTEDQCKAQLSVLKFGVPDGLGKYAEAPAAEVPQVVRGT
jgi:hypothetical protein